MAARSYTITGKLVIQECLSAGAEGLVYFEIGEAHVAAELLRIFGEGPAVVRLIVEEVQDGPEG